MAWLSTKEIRTYHGSISTFFSKSVSWWHSTWIHRRFLTHHKFSQTSFLYFQLISYLYWESLVNVTSNGQRMMVSITTCLVRSSFLSLFFMSFLTMIYCSRFLSCCISRITISMWTSQTLHSTTTFNHWLFSSHSNVTHNNNI